MPYYCTVPRCTSMAGKAKNVSFHQFPRDEELAKLWNNILKRGKPYTKYSKVCSLHFKPADYTITSAGKNKGQWRTLRKDAIPSQNLPSDTPAPYTRRQSGAWVPNNVPVLDQRMQAQHLAQAIYMQTMLAMQAAGVTDAIGLQTLCNGIPPPLATDNSESAHPNTSTVDKDVQLDSNHEEPDNDQEPNSNNEEPESDQEPDTNQKEPDNHSVHTTNQELYTNEHHKTDHESNQELQVLATSFKCDECSKCFKDPDVFILHKRTHRGDTDVQKENFDLNTLKPEMLRSNPILANLLKNTMERNIFNSNLFEKQIMVSFSNMENYLKSVTKNAYDDDCDNSDLSDTLESNNLVIDENVA